ncbi:MAG: hypothetical protein RLZZ133_1316 [Pseudomonadota bacterium]|jgi:tagatose 1,6-diphosphate aldolase
MKQTGKRWGLRRLATPEGFFSMAAIDQRPPISKFIARKRGLAETGVSDQEISAIKGLLAQGLAPSAGALLVDPNYGYSAAAEFLRPDRGLLITLEDHRFEETETGRKSRLIANWSVEKIRRMGADAVKLLAWYRPDASADSLTHQREFVRRVGEDCAKHDIAFVFELLVYPFASTSGSFKDYLEDPNKQADHVLNSVWEFSKPIYQVDLLKLESPIPAKLLPDPESEQAKATQLTFNSLSKACQGLPWVLLSAGAGFDAFTRAMTFAARAGASGFLAGRALWADLIEPYPDQTEVIRNLQVIGAQRISTLEAIAMQYGNPWRAHFKWPKGLSLSEHY